MQGKHALILYHWSTTWWPCVTGLAGRRLGGVTWEAVGQCGQAQWCHTLGTYLSNPPPPPHPARRASDYFILRAFYDLTVINGNDSAVFYKGNKENSQMRSRTKWAISALQWGRRLPGLRGRGAGFLLRIFASLTSTLQPLPTACSSWLFRVK